MGVGEWREESCGGGDRGMTFADKSEDRTIIYFM